MGKRITAFMTAYLGLPEDEVVRQRKLGYAKYGTTLEWLMTEKGFTDIEGYYAAVHPDGEETELPADPALRVFLESLPVKLAVLTNSNREHADRILAKLGIGDLFTHIFDMRWNNFQGKPRPAAFTRALDTLGSAIDTTLFIDDFPAYVEGFRALGGRGILLDEFDHHLDFPGPRIRALTELTAYLD
jgi:putative hydrolase of the HAD superfamily